jgi:hypothetical protein
MEKVKNIKEMYERRRTVPSNNLTKLQENSDDVNVVTRDRKVSVGILGRVQMYEKQIEECKIILS